MRGGADPGQESDPRQTVIRHTDTASSLTDRWAWAKAEAGRKEEELASTLPPA